jgi:hypothetical protein
MSSAHYHTPHTRLSSDPLQRSIVPWRGLLTPDTWAGDQVHMVRNSSSHVGWKERKACGRRFENDLSAREGGRS